MTLFVETAPVHDLAPSQRIAKGVAEEAADIVEFLAHHEEVAMLSWQGEAHLRQLLEQPATIALVARSDAGQLNGALVGGVLGTRGMINHVAVKVESRGQGIGRRLVHAFEQALRERGIRRYFLFTSCTNGVARRFWTRQGCSEMTGTETTYERDL